MSHDDIPWDTSGIAQNTASMVEADRQRLRKKEAESMVENERDRDPNEILNIINDRIEAERGIDFDRDADERGRDAWDLINDISSLVSGQHQGVVFFTDAVRMVRWRTAERLKLPRRKVG